MGALRDFLVRQLERSRQLRGSGQQQSFGRDSRPPANPQGMLRSGMGAPVTAGAGGAPVGTTFGPPPITPVQGVQPLGQSAAAPPSPAPAPPAAAPAAPAPITPEQRRLSMESSGAVQTQPYNPPEMPGTELPDEGNIHEGGDTLASAEYFGADPTDVTATGSSAPEDDQTPDSFTRMQGPGYQVQDVDAYGENPYVKLAPPGEDLGGSQSIPDDYEQWMQQREGAGTEHMSPAVQLQMAKLLRRAGDAPWDLVPGAQAAPVRPWQQ